MSYLNFYGFIQEPFSNAPISKFYYNSKQHSDAIQRLHYVAREVKGLAIVTGQIGAGKTTIARRMLDSLPEDEYESALLVIVHSGITADWLLRRIALQLGVHDPSTEKLKLLGQLYRRLLEIHEKGKKAIVLIDEAQMLQTRELMEEFRGLLNLEVPGQKLISFIFFGLAELEKNLAMDPPLAQRVAVRIHLTSFDRPAVEAYIKHRLRLAGALKMVFSNDAVDIIHKASLGIPRVINTLCDNALLEAYFSRKPFIEGDAMQKVADNLLCTTTAAYSADQQTAEYTAGGAAHQTVTQRIAAKKRLNMGSIDAVLSSLQK